MNSRKRKANEILHQCEFGTVYASEALLERRAWLRDLAVYFKDESIPRDVRRARWDRLSNGERETVRGLMHAD